MIEIRSYRRVFELERRIYRIDRLRLNPAGVPVRGVIYFLVLVAIGVLAGALPLVAILAKALPWYLRALVLPGVGAALLALIRLEGRPFHLAAHVLLRYAGSPRELTGMVRRASVGARWLPAELLVLPDGSDPRIRRLRYAGPGAALVTVEHERAVGAHRLGARFACGRGHRSLTVRASEGARPLGQGEVIVLTAGARLVTRACGDGERLRARAG